MAGDRLRVVVAAGTSSTEGVGGAAVVKVEDDDESRARARDVKTCRKSHVAVDPAGAMFVVLCRHSDVAYGAATAYVYDAGSLNQVASFPVGPLTTDKRASQYTAHAGKVCR